MKTAQIEVDLPMLINHCGKLRMLSHRFVMMLSLCQQGVPRKAEYFAAAQEALKGLKTTARYFVNPEAVRDNLDHAALYLKRGDVLDPEAIAILSRFIVESDRLMQTAERDVLTLDDLFGHAEQAAGPLLAHFDAFLIASLDLERAFAFKGCTNLRSRHERYGRPRNIQKSF